MIAVTQKLPTQIIDGMFKLLKGTSLLAQRGTDWVSQMWLVMEPQDMYLEWSF